MNHVAALPHVPLRSPGSVTSAFRRVGVNDFQEAARYVQALPYGRTSRRDDIVLVIVEGRGTCSSKHALLAALAEEQGVDVTLALGIFEMSEGNTPGVGRVLHAHGLEAIPEAHCYLVYRGRRIDITSERSGRANDARVFLHEESIRPAQVDRYKVDRHKAFLVAWIAEGHGAQRTVDEIWAIREACIAALSEA